MSYVSQYAKAIERYMLEGLYSAAWFVVTRCQDGVVSYHEPLPSATAATLALQIRSRVDFVRAVAKGHARLPPLL